MKIALVCTEKLPVPPIAGGAVQLYIEGILPKLSEVHEITVFGVEYRGLPKEEERDGVRYVRVPGKSRNEYVRQVQEKLKEGYDLVHVFNRPNFVVKFSEVIPNTKFSLSLHNEMFHHEKISIQTAVECINKVEFITTVSNFIAEGVRKLYPVSDSKLFPVYSGVDPEIYTPAYTQEGRKNQETLKKKYGLENKKVVLFVGRLSVKKGVDKLLNAMKKVMELRDDVALVVIGSKWYGDNKKDDYARSVETLSESLNGPVIFTGFLPPSEIPLHYNLGDIFICPSQWDEPLARVHYEAMAAGLPIITTNRGGNAEVIEGYGNGIIIEDYSNSEAFSDEILKLLNDPGRALAMGQKGRLLAERKYSWHRVGEDLLKLFKQVETKTAEAAEAAEEAEEVEEVEPEEVQAEIRSEKEIEKPEERPSEWKTAGDPYLTAEEAYYLKLFEAYLD